MEREPVADNRERPKHPSGQPIRTTRKVDRGCYNIPHEGSLIPRLQRKELSAAVGFHHFTVDDGDDE